MKKFWTLMLAGMIALGISACSQEQQDTAKAKMEDAAEATKDAAMEVKEDAGQMMEATAETAGDALANSLRPSFEDYGLTVKRVTRTFGRGRSRSTIRAPRRI